MVSGHIWVYLICSKYSTLSVLSVHDLRESFKTVGQSTARCNLGLFVAVRLSG